MAVALISEVGNNGTKLTFLAALDIATFNTEEQTGAKLSDPCEQFLLRMEQSNSFQHCRSPGLLGHEQFLCTVI